MYLQIFLRFKTQHFKLKSIGKDIHDDMIIMKIICILPDHFKHFATSWEAAPIENKTITNLTSRLISEEIRMSNTSNTITEDQNPVAFQASKTNKQKFNKNGPYMNTEI